MGHRSWLTPVETKSEWEKVSTSIDENPYAYGINYVLKITSGDTPFPVGSIVVAWSANGTPSVDGLKPKKCRDKTWFLDTFLDAYPEWHTEPGGPGKFGEWLTSDEEVFQAFDKKI